MMSKIIINMEGREHELNVDNWRFKADWRLKSADENDSSNIRQKSMKENQ